MTTSLALDCATCPIVAQDLSPGETVTCMLCGAEITREPRAVARELGDLRRWLPAILGRACGIEPSSRGEPVDGRHDWLDEEHRGLSRALDTLRWFEQLVLAGDNTAWILWGTYVQQRGPRNSGWCRVVALLAMPQAEAFDALRAESVRGTGPEAHRLIATGRQLIATAVTAGERVVAGERSSGLWIPGLVDRCSRAEESLVLLESQAAAVRVADEERRAELKVARRARRAKKRK